MRLEGRSRSRLDPRLLVFLSTTAIGGFASEAAAQSTDRPTTRRWA
jgi:hypothetical protein